MKEARSKKGEYEFVKSCGSAVRSFIALELLFHAALIILGQQFGEWRVSAHYQMRMQIILILVFVLFEVAAPACRRYRMLVNTILELMILTGFGLFAFFRRVQLQLGYQAVYNDFIVYWNDYNGSNYGTYSCDGTGKETALCFAILIVVIFSMTVRYVAGIRMMLLVPCFLVLSLGLLVNTLPDWIGLGLFFIGIVVLYSGSWESSKVVFQTRQGKRNHKQAAIAAQMGSLFLVTVIGIGVVFLTPRAFDGAAGSIPEKAKKYRDFQMSLEEKVKNLGNFSFVKGKVYVDNQTPEFNNEQIMQIRASDVPMTNIYMKNYESGTYVRGEWKKDNAFPAEAKNAGYEPEDFMAMLNQHYFEYQRTVPNDYYWKVNPLQYTINYQIKTGDAFVPYFADLSESKNAAWYDRNGIAKKKKSLDTLTFQGLEINLCELQYQNDYIEERENDDFDWYGQFVCERCRAGSEDVPAAKEYAQKVAVRMGKNNRIDYGKMEEGTKAVDYLADQQIAQWLEDPYLDYSSTELDRMHSELINAFRMEAAEKVRDELRNLAAYNLYLDDIPEGTDTIQYFLETGHEGYCMHFASAGVLILQELGVPARYASGYVVRNQAFEPDGKEYKADVIDRNAHAWVEIYLDNYGWMPYEMTPQYRDFNGALPTDEKYDETWQKRHMEKVQNQQESQESQDESESSETESETETQTQVESQDSENSQKEEDTQSGKLGGGNSQAGANNTLRMIVIVMIVFIAAAVFLWLGVRASRRYREILIADLHARRNRHAVRRMNRRIYHRLWNHAPEVLHIPMKKRGSSKVQFSYLTDGEFLQKLIRTYPSVSQKDWKRYMEIVQKAVFSEEEITSEEVRFCYRIYRHYLRR